MISVRRRRYREAAGVCKRYLEYCRLARRPPSPQVLLINAQCGERLGTLSEAFETFESVAKLYYERYPEFKVALADGYASAGRMEDARATVKSVLKDHPKLESALKVLEKIERSSR